MCKWILAVFLLALSPGALAQDVVEVTVEQGSSKGSAATARQEIFEKAIREVSLNYIREIIGEQKTDKNLSLIRNKILKESGKYVLFVKSTGSRRNGDQYLMNVNMKLSLKNLETLLLNEGLLYRMEGPPKLLPMVAFVDRVNSQSLVWWSSGAEGTEKAFLSEQSRLFHDRLRQDMQSKGFFALNPSLADGGIMVPEVFRSENPPTEDYLFLGEYFKAQIIVRGQFLITTMRERSDSYRLDLKLTAMQSSNGRVIGEVIRSYETDVGPFRQVVSRKLKEVTDKISSDLAVQLHDAWKSGTFGATLLQLAVNGKLNYEQTQEFKRAVLKEVRDVKTLKERLFEPGRIVFEMDASGNSTQLAQAIKGKSIPGFQVKVDDVRPEGLQLEVIPR